MPKDALVCGREFREQGKGGEVCGQEGGVCGQEGGVLDRGWTKGAVAVEEGYEGTGLIPSLWSPGELLIEAGAEQCEGGESGVSCEGGLR